MTDISVIIPTLNDEATIEACLDSVTNQTYPDEAYEVIIVDGGSTDGTLRIAELFDCEIVFENQGTISYAREYGVSLASSKYIAFTDADCVVPTDWLEKLVSKLQSCGDVAGVGGPNVTPTDDTAFAKAVGNFFKVFSQVGARYGFTSDSVVEVSHNPTCNVIYKKSVLKEVGGFNEQLVTVDDEEMDYRITEQGYRLLFRPDIAVDHYRRPTWKRFARMAYNYGYGRGQAVRLHLDLGKWFHVAPTIALLVLATVLVASIITPLSIYAAPALFSVGEAGIVMISIIMGLRTNQPSWKYILLINIWMGTWAIAFPQGLLDSPERVSEKLNAD